MGPSLNQPQSPAVFHPPSAALWASPPRVSFVHHRTVLGNRQVLLLTPFHRRENWGPRWPDLLNFTAKYRAAAARKLRNSMPQPLTRPPPQSNRFYLPRPWMEALQVMAVDMKWEEEWRHCRCLRQAWPHRVHLQSPGQCLAPSWYIISTCWVNG